MLMASSWSCVTCTKVMPTSCWMSLELELELLAQAQVQRAERLVEQQRPRAVHERAGERDALLLAAGQLRRPALAELPELDDVESLGDAPLDLVLADLLALEAEGDVLLHREVREQRVGLEDRVDVALVRRVVVTSSPPRWTRPAVGSSNPPIMRSVVVLPQPDGPSIAKKLPRGISRSSSSTAVMSPNRLVTLRSAMSAVPVVPASAAAGAVVSSPIARTLRLGPDGGQITRTGGPGCSLCGRFGHGGARGRR